MVLGLLWTLILEFDINRVMKAAAASAAVSKGKNAFNFKPGQAKDSLLEWVRSRVGKYGLNPQNFAGDFCDGNVLLALVHSLRPDLYQWNSLDRSNPSNNIAFAMANAERNMGIPPLLDPNMLLGGNPDEKAVMTYVVQFLCYQQENQAMVDHLANQFGGMGMQEDAERQRREMEELQRKQLEDQKRQMEELARQQAILEEQKRQMMLLEQQKQQLEQQRRAQQQLEEQKRALAQQQAQLQAIEEQKRRLAMQKAQMEEQQRQMQMQQMEKQRQQMQQIEMQKQQLAAMQAQQQQQLQMAAEVARMKFFQALQQQQQEGLGKRNYVLFVDKSGSMAGGRWSEARKAVEALAPQVTKACPQGISLYFFNNECIRIDNITTAHQVHEFFAREKPDKGTNLSLALQHAMDIHFQKNQGKPETWLIITDGSPDRPSHVYEILKQAHGKFSGQNQITISFIQIGASDAAAQYLTKLRGSLPFIDTITQEELPKREFSSLFSKK